MSYKKVPRIDKAEMVRGYKPHPHMVHMDYISPSAAREFAKAIRAAYPNVKFKTPLIYGTPGKIDL